MSDISDFVRESNRIEGILRDPTADELAATEAFVTSVYGPHSSDVEALVSVFAPGHRLRSERGLNVRVGRYIAPAGGPLVPERLDELLDKVRNAQGNERAAYECHVAYEKLHPFTDGNGRSGRAIWLWMMGGHAPLGFLHQFYYQALESNR